jgi:hypothetical protein
MILDHAINIPIAMIKRAIFTARDPARRVANENAIAEAVQHIAVNTPANSPK